MKIKWFGASSFLITSDNGTRIITDPYQHNVIIENPPPDFKDDQRPAIDEPADIVTLSHGHFDHSYIYTIPGVFQLYQGTAPAEIKGIKLNGLEAAHGDNRGNVMVILMEVDGIRICHLGDLGRPFTRRQLAQIGRVDILMTPWDNNNITMTFDKLSEVLTQLNAKIVLPIHHVLVDEFITSRSNFKKVDVSEMEFHQNTLPPTPEIILMKPLLFQGEPMPVS